MPTPSKSQLQSQEPAPGSVPSPYRIVLGNMKEGMLPDFIEALLDPPVYPQRPERVELVQTHISYVLLAGDHVFKVKKAVKLGFLDFSSLALRKHYCEEEVRLNSRLCPALYYGVEPIVRTPAGFRFGG